MFISPSSYMRTSSRTEKLTVATSTFLRSRPSCSSSPSKSSAAMQTLYSLRQEPPRSGGLGRRRASLTLSR